MADFKQMAEEYRRNIIPMEKRVRELELVLRLLKRRHGSASEIVAVRRGIMILNDAIAENRAIAAYLEHYYEKEETPHTRSFMKGVW